MQTDIKYTFLFSCKRSIPTSNERAHNFSYYMEESVLLGTKPLVDSIRHFIRDPSGVFSVCHLCECRIVQWRHDSRLLLLLNWFLHIIKRTLHVGSKIWILCSRGKNNISLEHKIHIFSPPFNILYISVCFCYVIWLTTLDSRIHVMHKFPENKPRVKWPKICTVIG